MAGRTVARGPRSRSALSVKTIGIPKETAAGERRVAASPMAVRRMRDLGFGVVLEEGAGEAASYGDDAYREAGARIETRGAVLGEADVVLAVCPPDGDLVGAMRSGQALVSFLFPARNEALVEALAGAGVTALAMDQVPRITRAQKMDALSSTANIAGYRAVVEASNEFGRFFTGQITAAGKVPPAKVLVIGAGVAGLAAIGAARGLGAIVRAFDTRASVKEQIKSLGGEFLTVEIEESGEGGGGYAKTMSPEFIEAEMALFREQAKDVDIVITTALVPGKKAPLLWTRDMVEAMKPGSVIVDLAAEQGGNCELTRPGERTVEHGVVILGYTDLASRMANVASDLYGTNLAHLLDEMGGAEGFDVDLENEVVRGALVTHGGEIMWPPPERPAPPPPPKAAEPAPAPPSEPAPPSRLPRVFAHALGWGLGGLWVWLRLNAGDTELGPETERLLQQLTVFALACFVGWQVIWSVTAALHTPLMSVTNAISGIIVVGGLLLATEEAGAAASWIGAAAVLFATINIVGGFHVTRRMLRMFHK